MLWMIVEEAERSLTPQLVGEPVVPRQLDFPQMLMV